MAETGAADTGPAAPPAKELIYCGVCSLPPEYCEFGGTAQKCEEWLEDEHPDMHAKLYSDETLNANLTTLSLDAQKRADRDAAKKTAKATAQAARAEERRAAARVTIRRIERAKRKHVTAIAGLDAYDLELKKVAKELGKRFATGSSVTKVPSGGEEITVQGDLADDIFEFLTETWAEAIPEANVDIVEEKKKKGAG